MGFPLSRFQMLSQLCSQDNEVRAELRKFKLICIVLHDPDDKAFLARMKRSFMDLHERTGKDLLFITFIDPPKEWSDPDRLGYKYVEPQRLCADPGFDGWLIIRHLLPKVLPDSALPCLLITNDLLSREYVVMDSSVDRFETQLIRLGEYCSGVDGRFPVLGESFLRFASTLGTCHLQELTGQPLAAALTDVLALGELANGSHEADRWAMNRIAELKMAGEDAAVECARYESSVEKGKKRRDALSRPIPTSMETYREGRHVLGRDLPGLTRISSPTLYASFLIQPKSIRDYHLCDVRSRGNILDYNDLLDVFIPKRTRDESRAEFVDGRRSSRRSYKQLAQPLAEFFEREVNLTLVQFMRSRFGIEMPEYYRKFKRGCYAVVRTPKEVPLNACEYPDRLKFVLLGNALYAYKVMCDRNGPFKMPDLMGGLFQKDWEQMVSMRNKIDHADYYAEDFFGFREFRGFHEVFTSILQNSLWKMEAIGKALREGGDLPEFEEDLPSFSA